MSDGLKSPKPRSPSLLVRGARSEIFGGTARYLRRSKAITAQRPARAHLRSTTEAK